MQTQHIISMKTKVLGWGNYMVRHDFNKCLLKLTFLDYQVPILLIIRLYQLMNYSIIYKVAVSPFNQPFLLVL